MRVLQSIVAAILSVMVIASPLSETPELKTIKGNEKFAHSMYKIVSRGAGNVVFSPFSAHAALSMLYQGVSGPLVQEFADVLNVQEPSTAANGYKSIMDTLNSSENVTLLVANKAYINTSLSLLQTFQTVVQEKFHAEVESINFEDANSAAATINEWVKHKTQDKIEELFQPGDLDKTIAALVNTVYFKSEWANEFPEMLTRQKPFYYDNENSALVDTMQISAVLPIKDSDRLNAVIIDIPYKNKDFNLVIVLPREKDGIRNLESHVLDFSDINDMTKDLKEERVILAMPKFKVEKSLELKPTLSEMGLKTIFEHNPYMNGIVDGDLEVSAVIQKVIIQVNEKGSVAAAATGVVTSFLNRLKVPAELREIEVDHPFLFFLTHKRPDIPDSRNILFYGRVERPSYE